MAPLLATAGYLALLGAVKAGAAYRRARERRRRIREYEALVRSVQAGTVPTIPRRTPVTDPVPVDLTDASDLMP